MDSSEKRSFKVTNSRQFQELVSLMAENVQLAKSLPMVGSRYSRYTLEDAWDDVARKINVYGPPERTGFEWRKIWADLKCRTKKKVFENSKIISSGESMGRILYLTELEQSVDKILEFSATAMSQACEESLKNSILPDDITELLDQPETKPGEEFITVHSEMPRSPDIPATKKPKHLRFLGKRKYDKSEKQFKLLQLQIKNQEKLLAAVQMQSTATQALADAANRQAEYMSIIAESTQTIASALKDAIKYLKKDETT